jgi:hypothetical protein
MRRILIGITAMSLLAAVAVAPVAARSPHQVDPNLMVPPLNPNLAPWTCWETGNGIICEGSVSESFAGEDIGEECAGQPIYITGSLTDRVTRWHTPDGRATRTFALQGGRETWSLSADGSGPTITVKWQVSRHYTYFTPGELGDRQLTEAGAWAIATAPGAGLVFQNAGRITYAVGASNDHDNPVDLRGHFDIWTDWDATLERVCAALGA